MTKLLLSVRSVAEAQIALDEGVDLIDVKEPARGSLGAADAATIAAVAEQVAGRVPLSAALGELLSDADIEPLVAGRLDYAKFGLAGCAGQAGWQERWQAALEALPPATAGVAVVYADWRAATAPEPKDIVSLAAKSSCAAVLLDTFDKSQGSLERHIGMTELKQFIDEVQRRGMLVVVAGSLGQRELARILPLEPDYVGIRGAACVAGRDGDLDALKVRRLVQFIRGPLAARLP